METFYVYTRIVVRHDNVSLCLYMSTCSSYTFLVDTYNIVWTGLSDVYNTHKHTCTSNIRLCVLIRSTRASLLKGLTIADEREKQYVTPPLRWYPTWDRRISIIRAPPISRREFHCVVYTWVRVIFIIRFGIIFYPRGIRVYRFTYRKTH